MVAALLCHGLRGCGSGRRGRVALAHSFGPYVQFWASYEGAGAVRAMAVALGGMDSVQRLETISEYRASTLLCTPSYAVHLAKVAEQDDRLDALESVEKLICTGEPGASLPRRPSGDRGGSGTLAASTMPGCPRWARSATRARRPAACT